MKPGPELDALIADKVMNWYLSDIDSHYYPKGSDSDVSVIISYRFRPSTDISAAWQVVEKLRERKLLSEFTTELVELTGADKYCGHDTVEQLMWLDASMVSEIICLAALKAVGVEIE